MLDDNFLELIEITSEMLDLQDSVVEKDYYVTQIIHALSDTETDYFKLIFYGGTCLSKAHNIVKRMSEDVDFKIHAKKSDSDFSKTKFLKELKKFRELIIAKLKIPGLFIGQPMVLNEGRYSRIEIHYPSVFPMNINLRPHILLEFTLSNIILPSETLSIKTLIEKTLKNIKIFTESATQCVSINETEIEKWVGITRRIIAIERKYHDDDKTLIRHMYDLNAINLENKITLDFFALAKPIIHNDAIKFKNQHPEYYDNPHAEIKNSLSLLKNDPIWKMRYEEFIGTMVYDNTYTIGYEQALNTLEYMSEKIVESLHFEFA